MKYDQHLIKHIPEYQEAYNLQHKLSRLTRRQTRAVKRFLNSARAEHLYRVVLNRTPVGSSETRRHFDCDSCDLTFNARMRGVSYPDCPNCGHATWVRDH